MGNGQEKEIDDKEKEYKFGQTVKNMKVGGLMTRDAVKGDAFIQMETYMKACGKMIKQMEKEFIEKLMGDYI